MLTLEKILSEFKVDSVNELVAGKHGKTKTKTRSRTRTRTMTKKGGKYY